MLDKSDNHSNRLIGSLSPYLQQHAYNPVDWYEWGEEAFEKARHENKLMLVSIGYSACHWCHVMAHESFEDPETAALMNQYFVCIKIDREELPDIDQLYMDACQLVNGSGGWPLNAFTLPDKRPIHALTYLPKNQWQKLLGSIHGLWRDNPAAAEEYAVKLSKGIAGISMPPELQVHTEEESIGEALLQVFIKQYDAVYGGPARAPKFPMPNNYRYLLQYGEISGDKRATDMGLFTLKHMGLGGIYDIVGGGFSRYSVDARWFAPHFEKMLYDNAQLISLYSYAFSISQNQFFRQVALQTLDFCWEELYSHDDLYYSAYDADSEGVEGLYYTYTYAELEQVLGEDTLFFCQYFQCTKAGNWEHGRNILYALDTLPEASIQMDVDLSVFEQIITKCLAKLKVFRDNRVKPGLDDKHICSWNNLMLKALAEAAIWLQDHRWIQRADLLAASILRNFYAGKSLKRIAKNGTSKIDAFLEDHATLVDGLISLYQAGFDEAYLLQAKDICQQTIDKFFREEHGFFEFNSSATFITKKFDISDDVINSGNSIMAHNLWRLSWYFDLPEWRQMADRMLQAIVPLMKTSAPWYSHWAALQLIKENGTRQIIVSADDTLKQSLPLSAYYKIPNAIFGFAGKETAIPLFKGKEYQDRNLIFPCLDHVCNTPLIYEPKP